jgi:hypothetical protein
MNNTSPVFCNDLVVFSSRKLNGSSPNWRKWARKKIRIGIINRLNVLIVMINFEI